MDRTIEFVDIITQCHQNDTEDTKDKEEATTWTHSASKSPSLFLLKANEVVSQSTYFCI